jgi:hypothetical protein
MLINYPTLNANTPSIASSTTVSVANPKRIAWNIQNLGQNVLYVLLGTGASTSVFHVALKAATANDDGTGGSVGQETGVIYTGVITIAGTSPRYVFLEQAPGTLTAPN